MGVQDEQGQVPVTVTIEEVPAEAQTEGTGQAPGESEAGGLALVRRIRHASLASWLFVGALLVYLLTRLIGLTHFPIYFFTDEAIQTQAIVDLIQNGYKDVRDVWLPTYFRNGEYYNLSLSVYMQWLPYVLFGKSAWLTRAVSVFITLLAAFTVGWTLRDIFKLKYWWTGTLFLALTPAWFLHSRTAFETAEFVAWYAGTLWAYLMYRHRSPRYLALAILFCAFAFYTYSPAQLVMPLLVLGLLVSDWRYHLQQWRALVVPALLGLVLTLPYIRSTLNKSDAPLTHLRTLYSYWFEPLPLTEKILRYLNEFGIGLSPWYWYIPNDRDLARHLMKDYGHILLITLPFAVFGLAYLLRNLRQSEQRTVLLALLVTPASAALVQIGITRTLAFVVPMAILTAIGFERYLLWMEDPHARLRELAEGPGPTSARLTQGGLILAIGLVVAAWPSATANRLVLGSLAILLALQVSGLLERIAQTLLTQPSTKRWTWRPSPTMLALSTFALLAGGNFIMLTDALRNGSTWYEDYGLGGMQYGAFQVYDEMQKYLAAHPEARIIFSPDWANGTDVVTRFFLGEPSPIAVGSVRGHLTQKLPLDDNTLFVATPQDFDLIVNSNKFTDVRVEQIIQYPNGAPGFYFVRLRYVPNIDAIFAAERAERLILRESQVQIDGEATQVRHTYLESADQAKAIQLVFDHDPFTVAKTFDINPFVIEATFPQPRTVTGFSVIIGSATVRVTLSAFPVSGAPVSYTFDGQGSEAAPELSFELPEPLKAQVIQLEILDPNASDQGRIHLWEWTLR